MATAQPTAGLYMSDLRIVARLGKVLRKIWEWGIGFNIPELRKVL
jgi:hypothetical protein